MASDTGAVPTPIYHRPPMPAPRRRPAIKETPVEQRPGEALIWTDGACSGNPGPGGWAAIVIPADGGDPIEHSGGERQTTNNRMELTAALEGLRSLPDGADVDRGHRLAADAQLDDGLAAGLEEEGLEDRRGQAGQEPGPARGAGGRGQPARAACAGTGCAGTRPAPGNEHKALNDRADQLAVAAAQRLGGLSAQRLGEVLGAAPAPRPRFASERVVDQDRVGDQRERDAVVGARDDVDLVAGLQLALGDDPQVGAGPARLGEALDHLQVAEAQPELRARQARLADLELDACRSASARRSPRRVTSTPSVVRFSPNIPSAISRPSSSAHQSESSRAYA